MDSIYEAVKNDRAKNSASDFAGIRPSILQAARASLAQKTEAVDEETHPPAPSAREGEKQPNATESNNGGADLSAHNKDVQSTTESTPNPNTKSVMFEHLKAQEQQQEQQEQNQQTQEQDNQQDGQLNLVKGIGHHQHEEKHAQDIRNEHAKMRENPDLLLINHQGKPMLLTARELFERHADDSIEEQIEFAKNAVNYTQSFKNAEKQGKSKVEFIKELGLPLSIEAERHARLRQRYDSKLLYLNAEHNLIDDVLARELQEAYNGVSTNGILEAPFNFVRGLFGFASEGSIPVTKDQSIDEQKYILSFLKNQQELMRHIHTLKSNYKEESFFRFAHNFIKGDEKSIEDDKQKSNERTLEHLQETMPYITNVGKMKDGKFFIDFPDETLYFEDGLLDYLDTTIKNNQMEAAFGIATAAIAVPLAAGLGAFGSFAAVTAAGAFGSGLGAFYDFQRIAANNPAGTYTSADRNAKILDAAALSIVGDLAIGGAIWGAKAAWRAIPTAEKGGKRYAQKHGFFSEDVESKMATQDKYFTIDKAQQGFWGRLVYGGVKDEGFLNRLEVGLQAQSVSPTAKRLGSVMNDTITDRVFDTNKKSQYLFDSLLSGDTNRVAQLERDIAEYTHDLKSRFNALEDTLKEHVHITGAIPESFIEKVERDVARTISATDSRLHSTLDDIFGLMRNAGNVKDLIEIEKFVGQALVENYKHYSATKILNHVRNHIANTIDEAIKNTFKNMPEIGENLIKQRAALKAEYRNLAFQKSRIGFDEMSQSFRQHQNLDNFVKAAQANVTHDDVLKGFAKEPQKRTSYAIGEKEMSESELESFFQTLGHGRENVELIVLNGIVQRAEKKIGKDFVVDNMSIYNDLKSINPDLFITDKGKQAYQILDELATQFKHDTEILRFAARDTASEEFKYWGMQPLLFKVASKVFNSLRARFSEEAGYRFCLQKALERKRSFKEIGEILAEESKNPKLLPYDKHALLETSKLMIKVWEEREKEIQKYKEIAEKKAHELKKEKLAREKENVLKTSGDDVGEDILPKEDIGTRIENAETMVFSDKDKGYPASYQIVDSNKLFTSFKYGENYQFREIDQPKVVINIRENFDPKLIFTREGGFDGLPVVDNKGRAIIGNHRLEAMLNFNEPTWEKYAKEAFLKYGAKLERGQLLVRVLDPSVSLHERIALAKASNASRVHTDSERSLVIVGKYADSINALIAATSPVQPAFKDAANVNEMRALVAAAMNDPLEKEATNHALLLALCPDFIARKRLLQREMPDVAEIIQQMLNDNAGALLLNAISPNAKNIDISKYLAGSLRLIAEARKFDKQRRDRFIQSSVESLNIDFKNIYDLEKVNGVSPFEQFKADLIALALARFSKRENPSGNLYAFLKEIGEKQEHSNENLFGEEYATTLWDNLLRINRIDLENGEDAIALDIKKILTREKEYLAYKEQRERTEQQLEQLAFRNELLSTEDGRNALQFAMQTKMYGTQSEQNIAKEILAKQGYYLNYDGALSIIEGKAKPENPIETLSKNAEIFFGTDTSFMQQMREGFTGDINKKWWIVPRGKHSVVEYAKEIDPSLVSFERADVGSWYADVQGIVHKVALKKQDTLMIEHYASNEIPPAKTWIFHNENQITHLMQAYNGDVLLIDTLNKDNTRTILAKNKDTITKTSIDANGNATTTNEEAGKNVELFSKFLQEDKGTQISTFKSKQIKNVPEIVRSVKELQRLEEEAIKPLEKEYEEVRKELRRIRNTKPILKEALEEIKETFTEDRLNELTQQRFRTRLSFKDIENYNYWRKFLDNDKQAKIFEKYDKIIADNAQEAQRLKKQLEEIDDRIKNAKWDLWNIPQELRISQDLQRIGYFTQLRRIAFDGYTDYSYSIKHLGNKDNTAKDIEGIREKLLQGRKDIEDEIGIQPIEGFGINYAEFYHDGRGAITKILAEARDYEARKAAGKLIESEPKEGYKGQVSGAFYREDLGDIDLVWGDSSFGMQHILERRTTDFGEQKALEIIDEIPKMIEQGKIYKEIDGKIEIITDKYTLVLGIRDDNKFVISALRDSRNKKRLGTTQTGVADSLTGETLENNPLSPSQTAPNSTPPNIKDSLENGDVSTSFQHDNSSATEVAPPKNADTSVGERAAANQEPQTTNDVDSQSPSSFFVSQDFGEALALRSGKQRLADNLEALRTLGELAEGAALNAERQQSLARYSGFGGLMVKDVEGMRQLLLPIAENDALIQRALLGKGIYDAHHKADILYSQIAANADNSYYTPHSVISAIWEHLGFVKGRVLEPSMGIGNFFTSMPAALSHRTQKVGVEIDPIAAAIGKQLSPDVDVQAKSFYDYKGDVGFDLVIGNPPYGEHLKDFILKSVDSAKENGIIVQVVSNAFLDNMASRDVRTAIAQKAELLGAVRLPSKTFSGTDIATDIVVFQKRSGKQNSTYWRGAKTYKEDSELTLNNYYHENPEHILGELVVGSTQYGQRWIVKQGEDIEDALHEKLGAILAKRENESDCIIARQNDVQEAVASGFTPHTFFVLNDTIMQAQKNAEPIPVDFLQSVRGNGAPFETLNKSAQTRRTNEAKKAESMARDYLTLRDSLLAMRSSEALDSTSEESLQSLRQTLNDNYDSFVQKFGKVSENTLLKKVFAEDPSFSSVADLDARGRHQILDSRVIFPYQIPTKAKDIQDAIAISKGYAGKISEDYINELLGDRYAVQKALESGELFADAKGNLFTKDAFVVGDLGARIDAFKELKELNPQQKKALETLEAALPEPLEIHEIYYHPSSNFIPKEAMLGFFDSLGVKATYYKPTNSFIIDHKSGSHTFQTAYSAVTKNMEHSATAVLESLLKNKPLRFSKQVGGVKQSYPEQFAANKMAQDKLFETFYSYMQKHYAKDIADSYNHKFRRIVANDFQDEPILYGANPDIKLHPHQKSAIAFATSLQNVLLDHSVGAGKTYEMIAIASEWKRLGISKNPLFVVPNHLVEQWAKSFTQLYPASRVLSIPTNENERKRTLAMLANGGNDFDAVIMPYSTFDSIHLSNKKAAQYVYEEIQELEQFEKEIMRQRSKDPLTEREQERLEKSIAKKKIALQQKYDKLLDTKATKEDSITFEELGFDSLFVDEAHAYKNLGFLSANRNIRGMGNAVGSQKALNLLHKVKSMQEREQRIVFATGTPLVNSVSEVYTWQRFLAPQFLKDNKIASFDSWVNLFGQVSSELERTPVGTYKDIMRLRSFKNTSELSTLYRQFAHYVDVSQTHIKRPNVEQVSIQCQSSPQQKEYMQHLLKRYEALSKDETIEGFENDNFLNITTDGINAALDYRIIDKAAEDFSESKINRATSEMLKLYKESNKDLGTQLVFIDRSTPKPKRGIRDEIRNVFEEYYHAKDEKTEEALVQKLEEMAKKHHYDNIDEMRNAVYGDFSVYEDMRDKLIKAGIPKEQIAFIHDYTTDAQKAKLFADVNAGKIRFLFGSTKKMGAGMNVQERIVGLHHIDAAWNPADMEQRNGRAIRQGNLLAEKYADFKIKIFSYVTENSCDAVYYSKLEQKATSIKNFRSGHAQKDDLSDDVILTLEELKALATGDTRELEKASLNKELQNVQYQLNALKSADAFQEIERQNCTKDIKILPQEITNLKDDLDIAKQRKIRKLSEDEKESLRNLEIVPDNKEPLFRLDNYDVFLEKSPRGIYTLSAISDNGNEIVLLKQSEPPKNLAHYAQKLIEQSSAASIEARIAQREEELKSAHAKLKSIEQSTTGKEIATLEAKEKELSGKIAKLIKEMSAQPNNATKEESAKATTNLTAYQQQLLQRELAEFNAKFKEDSTVNPQQIDITDLESLATFFNGWRSVKDPIRAEDLLSGEILKEMMSQTNNKEFAHLLKNLEAISLSVDPKKDEYGIWKAFKAIQSDTDRAHITKERKLDKKKDPTRYAKEQERCRENLQENRERIEKALDIKPIQEFGTNYAEFYHDGVGAIKKLIAESKDYQSRKKAKELTKEEQENNVFRGQVAGAFYRKELGDITLAWGEVTDAKNHKGYGLAHILDKHPDFDVNLIAEIMEKGKLNIQNDVRARLEYGDYVVGLSREFKGEKANFIITAFEKDNGNKGSLSPKPKITDESDNVSPTHTSDSTPPNIKEGLENAETHESLQQQLQRVESELATNRERIDKSMPEDKPKLREIHRELLDKKKQIRAELGDKANTTQDATKTLAQQIQDTFKFSPQKARDLVQWHKESHPITKDEQGLPKVFYRLVQENFHTGRKVEFDVFSRQTSMKDIPNDIQDSAYGIAFYTHKSDIKPAHRNQSKLYEVFLRIKKPLDLDTIITKQNMAEFEQLFKRNNEPKHLKANIAEFENKPLIEYLIQKGFDQYPYSLMRKNEKGIHGQLDFNNLADFLSLKGYDSATKTIVGEGKIIYMFNPNQIKSIENKGKFDSSNNIYQSNLHVGSGILTGSIAGLETDEQGNISFNPEKFVLGFLAGAAGSKAISSALQYLANNPEHKKKAIDVIAQSLAKNVPDTLKKYPLLELVLPRKMSTSAQGLQAQTQTMISKLEQKEKRGLFNVVYNNKNATKIYKDLERIDEAIVLERGRENPKNKKGYGAQHILKHTQDEQADGYVTKYEVVNLGKNVRAFLKDNEPFIDSNGARIYEWQDKEGVRFRLVVGDMGEDFTTTVKSKDLSSPERIITFYSDRNLKNPMQFKNPALRGAK